MGMVANLLRVNSELLSKFIESPNSLEQYIYAEQNDSNSFSPEEIKTRDQNQIYLDKSWDAITYLLENKNFVSESNKPNLLKQIMFSNQFFDVEQDLGYGPGQYLTSKQVQEINIELTLIDENKISNTKEYLDKKGENLYVIDFSREEDVIYVKSYFKDLKSFYKKAAENNQAIILYIN